MGNSQLGSMIRSHPFDGCFHRLRYELTGRVTSACPDTGVINYEKVTSSPQSVITGVPVAVVGLVFFGAMVLMNLPRAWRCPSFQVHVACVALSAAGVAFALYFRLYRVVHRPRNLPVVH